MTADKEPRAASAARKAPRTRAALRASIGPVEDLESYVKADWWRDIFNENYLRTDADFVTDPEITTAEVDAFVELTGIGPDDAILDLCCGQGRHLIELARRGYRDLCGVDRSHYLISMAKRTAAKAGYTIRWREGDARKLRFPDNRFSLVFLAGNSFGYFESIDDDIAVLREIDRILKPEGLVLVDFTDGDYLREHFEPRSWEWIDKDYFVCRERSLSRDGTRLVSREVITHTRNGVLADQFYAERLYDVDQLRALVEDNGFDSVEARPMKANSKRGQDGGMMANRITLTARTRKTAGSAEAGSVDERAVSRVLVMMGDHRRPDAVKPDGVFDADDIDTVERLKEALAGLPDFRFTYVDDHDNLHDVLKRESAHADFVLNLCDEGFNNEATKELHVPALLEILGLPYSGGTPQCLACCYDKSLVRGVAAEMDVPVPEAFIVSPEQVTFIAFPLDFPVIVKPNFGDSSVGITVDSVCWDVQTLERAIARIRERGGYDRPVLVEEFLTGKDISVGIVGNPPDNYSVLPIVEEDYSRLPEGLPRICGYEAKWEQDSVYFREVSSIPAELPEATVEYLGASCIRLFQRLECRDYARFDWRLDANGTPRLLEVNPNPGWCWDGHLARMAAIANLSYADLLREILEACRERVIPAWRAGVRRDAA